MATSRVSRFWQLERKQCLRCCRKVAVQEPCKFPRMPQDCCKNFHINLAVLQVSRSCLAAALRPPKIAIKSQRSCACRKFYLLYCDSLAALRICTRVLSPGVFPCDVIDGSERLPRVKQGPVVQSIDSLTSSLRYQLAKCFTTLSLNTLIFLLKK